MRRKYICARLSKNADLLGQQLVHGDAHALGEGLLRQ
jgi:hypothetical protein